MTESKDAESSAVPANFDNLILKQWLYTVGPIHRCEALRKLKKDLQNLGYSRKQVYNGLVQLVTKPHVILTRVTPHRRHGLKRSLDKKQNRSDKSGTRNVALGEYSKHRYEKVPRPDTTERVVEEVDRQRQKSETSDTRTSSMESIQSSLASRGVSTLEENQSGMFHSFEKVLEQFDKRTLANMNFYKKPSSKRRPPTYSAENTFIPHNKIWVNNENTGLSEHFIKDNNHLNNIEKNNTHAVQEVGTNRVGMSNRGKKRRIRQNLSPFYTKKENECMYSDSCNIEMNYVKADVGIKLRSEKDFTNGRVDFMMNKDTYSKHESEGNVLVDTDVISIDKNACKEEVHDTMSSISTQKGKKIFALVDEKNELNRRKGKQLRHKFRVYFGNEITGSEGEEEENILNERFKRRRKKNSVDPCDSGVSYGKTRRTISSIETKKGMQRCISDCTMHEGKSRKSVVHDATTHEPGEITEDIIITEQAKDVTSVSKVSNNMKSAMYIKDNIETEKKEIFWKTLTNIYDRSNVLRKTFISDVEKSQVTEQLGINISVLDANGDAQVKAQQVLKLDTERKEQAELESATEIKKGLELELELEVETQPKVREAKAQSELNEVEAQPEVEAVQAQPEAEEVQAQSEVEAVQAQPEVEGKQAPGVGAEVQLTVGIQTQAEVGVKAQQEEKRVEAQARIERALAQSGVERANAERETEEGVEAQSPEIGSVEAQTRGSITVTGTDIGTNCEALRIYNSDSNIDDDLCQSQENNLTIFNELLHMSFNDTCRITSNGNVLSIQEIVREEKRQQRMNKVDENGNLKILPKMQPSYNHGIQKDMPSDTQDNNNVITKDTQLTIGANQNIKDVSINDVINIPRSVNEPIVQDSEVNSVTEYKNIQPSTVSQCRLRVLSSAELGSRWCPTPVNTLTSTVTHKNPVTMFEVPSECTTAVSSVQLETQTVPVTVAAPISTSVSTRNVGLQVAESVYVIFVKISNLIQSIRISSPITKLDYDKLLLIEFEKLRKVLNTNNYVALTEGVLCILNKELVLNPPLSLPELFRYTPLVKSLYVRSSQNFKGSVNNIHGHQNVSPSVIVSSQTTVGQNTYCNQKPSQNITTVSVQTRLRNLLTVSNVKDQTANITSKQLQKNSQEKAAVLPQNNTVQCNMGQSSIVVDNHNTQQTNCRTSVQRTFPQQKVPNGYFVKHTPITNVYATQGFAPQYSTYSSIGINPLGRRYISASIIDTPCINQEYSPQCVTVPQVNAFYNVHTPNSLVQQNPSSMYINVPNLGLPSLNQQYRSIIPRQSDFNVPQGITVQSVPQVALNYIPQPVQAMFTTNIPHSISKTVQQSEKINQNMLPQVQTKVLQNPVFKEVQTSQHAQNAYAAEIKQPVSNTKKIANMPVSLESTTKLFDVLKYLTNAQKLILLEHMVFYFSCTMWLEQQFTSDQWQKIHSQRSLLLHFQTLLKYLVEKTVKDTQNQSQANATAANIFPNVTIDVPKTAEVVQEHDEIYNQVGVSKSDQGKTQNTCQNSMTEEDIKNIAVKEQSVRHKEIDNLQDKEEFSQSQELVVPNQKDVTKNKLTKETTLLQNDNLTVIPVLETETILSITDQSLDRGGKIETTVPEVVNDKLSAVSDLKLLNEDMLQQSNLHLVTVEISSNRDQITVVDTNGVRENESTNQDTKECDEIQEQKPNTSNQLPYLNNNVCKESLITLVKTSNNTEHLNNADAYNSSLGELTISQIADVRSISLEAFEKMGHTEKVSSNIREINIEEEEIKVCLFCGKSSTVACSICLEAKYCSKTCFLLHWEKHYSDCTPVKSIYS